MAAKRAQIGSTSILTIPFPIVFAICNPKTRNAVKLKNDAQMTARVGKALLWKQLLQWNLQHHEIH